MRVGDLVDQLSNFDDDVEVFIDVELHTTGSQVVDVESEDGKVFIIGGVG